MNTDETGNAWWNWLFAGLAAIAMVALAVVTAGAIIAAAPAIAGMAGMLVSSLGFASLAGAAAMTVSIGAAVLAGATIAIGINEAVNYLTGFNPISSLIGEDAYNFVRGTVGILGYSYIMLGSMLPYPSTGDGTPKNYKEQIAMEDAIKNPLRGHIIKNFHLGDSRFPSWLGWQKYSYTEKFGSGLYYDIHYVGNKWFSWLKIFFDYKFKIK